MFLTIKEKIESKTLAAKLRRRRVAVCDRPDSRRIGVVKLMAVHDELDVEGSLRKLMIASEKSVDISEKTFKSAL